MRFLYHATAVGNLPGIRQHGLTPNCDRDPNWDGYPVNGRLYVAPTESAAEFYAETLAEMYETETAILRFPASSVTTLTDEFGNNGDRYTEDAAPSDLIEARLNNSWIPIASWPAPAAGPNNR